MNSIAYGEFLLMNVQHVCKKLTDICGLKIIYWNDILHDGSYLSAS